MIKEMTSRAMMISMLEQYQLEKIHEMEKTKGHLIANWNIQEIFGLPEIKYRYEIPDDVEKQISHNYRIDKDMERLGFEKTGTYYNERLDMIHAQDWNTLNRKSEIVWEYSGAKRSNLKDMLRGGM